MPRLIEVNKTHQEIFSVQIDELKEFLLIDKEQKIKQIFIEDIWQDGELKITVNYQ